MKPPVHHQEPLMVALRVRPLNVTETKNGATQIAHTVDKNLVVLMDPHDDADDILRANRSREKKYVFDCVFDSLESQMAVYNCTVGCKDIIGRVISGYNCTVFAYGATGTGKTYTMLGTSSEPGIMAITLNDLFKRVDDTKEDSMYTITVAYLEIYNEMVRDLLNPGSGILELREDCNGEVNVNGLLEVETTSAAEIMGLLRVGNQRRTSEPTAANKASSRSHAVLRVIVENRSRKMNVKQSVGTGVLFMVDLAGSERAAVTQNRGKRMIEGAHINRSLLALANCINALVSNNTHYVNYRDSKLTRLLKDALGGNCITVMIAHISPASTVFEESRNTLAYAERGKKIKNKTRQNVADVNYHITQYWHIIDELNSKVESLQSKLDQQQSAAAPPEERNVSVITELCEKLKAHSQEEKEIRQEILTLEYQLLQTAISCQKHLVSIREWEQKRPSLSRTSPLQLSAASDVFSARDTNEIPSILSPSLTDESCTPSEEKHNIKTSTVFEVDQQTSSNTQEGPAESSFNEVDYPSSADLQVAVKETESIVTGKRLSKPQLFIPTMSPLMEGGLAVTPDSGTCTEIPSDLPMEPLSVSNSREELATLVANKQRMEAQHRRLERRHKECRANMASIKEKISSLSNLLPIQKELIDLLYHTCDLEAAGMEQSLAATLMSMQLGRHESHIDQLLKQSSLLMDTVHHLQSIMVQHSIPIPVSVGTQCKELAERQHLLRAQVLAEKQVPLLSKQIQLPNLSRLSAKLYTTMTGSKTNLLIDESIPEANGISGTIQSPLTPVIALSDIQFLPNNPSAVQSPDPDNIPSLSTLAASPHNVMIPSFLQISSSSLTTDSEAVTLPPIDTRNNSLVAMSAPIACAPSQDVKQTSTEKRNDPALSHILEAARLAKLRQKQGTRVTNGSGSKAPLPRTSPKEVLSRVVSFTTPGSSHNKTKYVVPESTSCPTVISDLEGNESAECSQLQNSKSTSSMDSMLSSKPQLNNEESNKSSDNRQMFTKINGRTDIVQVLGGSRDPMSRNIITMEELMAVTKSMRPRGRHGSVQSTPLHKASTHYVQKKSNMGPMRTRVLANSAIYQNPQALQHMASKLPHVPATRPMGRPTIVSLPKIQRSNRQSITQRNTTKRKWQEQRKKELVVAKVVAGDQFSNIASPYLTPVRLPRKPQSLPRHKGHSWAREKQTLAKTSGVWK